MTAPLFELRDPPLVPSTATVTRDALQYLRAHPGQWARIGTGLCRTTADGRAKRLREADEGRGVVVRVIPAGGRFDLYAKTEETT